MEVTITVDVEYWRIKEAMDTTLDLQRNQGITYGHYCSIVNPILGKIWLELNKAVHKRI